MTAKAGDSMDYQLGTVEARFADLIWENEPLSSGELVKLSEQELGWKKSTTYTVLKKFCDRGIVRNEGSIVTAILKKDEFLAEQGQEFLDNSYQGSLPSFLAAFTAQKKLKPEEIDELQRLIDSLKKEDE